MSAIVALARIVMERPGSTGAWTVDRRHAVVAAVLPAVVVVVGLARRGKRFDVDRVTPIWRV